MISSFLVEFVAWASIDDDLASCPCSYSLILIFRPMPYAVVILS